MPSKVSYLFQSHLVICSLIGPKIIVDHVFLYKIKTFHYRHKNICCISLHIFTKKLDFNDRWNSGHGLWYVRCLHCVFTKFYLDHLYGGPDQKPVWLILLTKCRIGFTVVWITHIPGADHCGDWGRRKNWKPYQCLWKRCCSSPDPCVSLTGG